MTWELAPGTTKAAELQRMLAAVDRLARAMKAELRHCASEGKQGGLNPQNYSRVVQLAHHHYEAVNGWKFYRGDPLGERCPDKIVHVCNLLAMLWEINGRPKP